MPQIDISSEKVIEGLEHCTQYDHYGSECHTCIYYKDCATDGESLMRDALVLLKALLKAQEPVEPVIDVDTWTCGNCGHTLEHQQLLGDNVLFHEQYDYCPNCGRKVKWNA